MILRFANDRLRIVIRGADFREFNGECPICGATFRFDENYLDDLTRGSFKDALSLAKYYVMLEEFLAKLHNNEIKTLEALGKAYRKLEAQRINMRALAGFVMGATIICEECGHRIAVMINADVDTSIRNRRMSFDDVLKLEADLDTDRYLRSRTGKSWAELREEAVKDPRKKGELWWLLHDAAIIGEIAY